ncbi:hypothetical protein BDM02DRAFT_3122223 [Thelephora ganbajun]|uniref:Uncharacterized protein n=1 Tax=Thelephora ganbajun TaxID=370292 RepID=A0ACB6Z3Z8_THEGA|nr:hypothetical protein BDM02DRAFT_3122223 [Thelephora ganbajun]
MADVVIREITPEVVTFSKPFSRFLGWFPMGGRSTAIKLSSGDVWVIASTPFSNETKDAVEKLGIVKYILAADADHHYFLTEWKKNYPEAKMIGVETLPEKKKGEYWKFDEIYKPGSENKFGFEADIEAVYFSGFSKKDVAWFHKASKTLIVADLIFNLPANEQYSKSKQRKTGFLTKKLNPYAEFHKKFIWGESKDKAAMARDAKTVYGWDFERIIPCHGDTIETKAKEAWASVYTKFLDTPDPTPAPAAETPAETPAEPAAAAA